jgi:hypothetical protein
MFLKEAIRTLWGFVATVPWRKQTAVDLEPLGDSVDPSRVPEAGMDRSDLDGILADLAVGSRSGAARAVAADSVGRRRPRTPSGGSVRRPSGGWPFRRRGPASRTERATWPPDLVDYTDPAVIVSVR